MTNGTPRRRVNSSATSTKEKPAPTQKLEMAVKEIEQAPVSNQNFTIKEDKVSHEDDIYEGTYIVYNPDMSPHIVNDIKLTINGNDFYDLAWENETNIKPSRNLKQSLEDGLLVRITPDEAAYYEKQNKIRRRQEILQNRQQEEDEKRQFQLNDDRTIEAESLNILVNKRFDSGLIDDKLTFGMAHKRALENARAKGQVFNSRQFAEDFKNNPSKYKNIIKNAVSSGRDSGKYVIGSSDEEPYIIHKSKSLAALEHHLDMGESIDLADD
jgi:hypothetical protein